jgi:hypothetical protein
MSDLINLGDVVIATHKESGEPKKDKHGRQMYYMKISLPKGMNEVTLKSGDYINFRDVSDEEVEEMPDWKRKVIQLKSWCGLGK